MIKTIVSGRLTKDCTTNTVSGKNVINFTVATDIGYGANKKALFIDAAYWTDKDGIVPYLKKGTQVLVEGEPGLREWEANGKHGASFTLRVNQVELIGGGKQTAQTVDASGITEAEDDLPF
jgi:single-strand DNA-binding protein